MKHSLVIPMLWAYAGWTAGAAFAWVSGASELLGPLCGLVALCACVALRARGSRSTPGHPRLSPR